MAAEIYVGRADEQLAEGELSEALQLYTLGLKEKNATAEHWVKRADLHYRLEQSDAALADVESALNLEPGSFKAYLVRGKVRFARKEFPQAKIALRLAKHLRTGSEDIHSNLAPDETAQRDDADCERLYRQCYAELGGTEEADRIGFQYEEAQLRVRLKLAEAYAEAEDAMRQAAFLKKISEERAAEAKGGFKRQYVQRSKYTEEVKQAKNIAAAMIMQSKAERHDWYQTSEHVVVAVMLKNCDPAKNKLQVSFSKDKLICMVNRIPDAEYRLDLDLFGEIVPELSKYTVRQTKIEIKLKKGKAAAAASANWPGLTKPTAAAPATVYPEDATPAAVEPTPARLEEQKWNNVANMANQEATVAKPVAATPTDDQVLLNKIEDMYANSDDKTRAIMDDRFKDAMNKSIQNAMQKNQQKMMDDMAKAHNPIDDDGNVIPTA